ncbi:putative CutA1 divalent ion tolerance protein [Campylobacter iguaniorum]|uniref:Putative CutA1 divalent ion tolerance protein n=1 Tax=Campylobacter iguaniorum TaxID=1244531 RepID=A0A076FC11_9BACT|nr:divalent-cation tolerance protein CutA [Campylobacter iguaniorum]AII14962.1 putative CutA1 divalent ion tolerance protein [Campylobacter iguaniorum]
MIVLNTAPDKKTAKKIAKKLVNSRAAACVNILPNLTSIYAWNGKIRSDKEVLMIAKGRYKKIKKMILKFHPYELPEIIALKPKKIEKTYKKWIKQNTKGKKC